MKLIKCHVTGFGKISDKTIDFNSGLNVFCEENGYGKSTLASFIKVMLYGFEDENKRSLKDKEREKFRPWNKGLFGGSITFEYEGVEYEVTRTFGKNENEDSFEVRKLPENTVCRIFDKNTMGTTIFGIDKESFFRTAYIASPDQNKRDESVTDSIRAKLGNLTDATDDINNFDTACLRFEKKMNELTPDRKSGKIKSLKTEIAEKNNRVRTLEDVEKAIEILENQIHAQIERTDNDKRRIKDLKEKESLSVKAEAIKVKKERYDSIKKESEEAEKKVKEIKDYFSGNVPELKEISNAREKNENMKHLIPKMNENRFFKDERWEKLEDKFKDGICSEEEVKRYISLWDGMQKKKKEVADNEYNLKAETKEYLDKANQEARENYEKNLTAYGKSEKSRKIRLVIFSLLTLGCFGGAIYLTICGMMGIRENHILYPEVILFVVGVLCLALIVVLKLYKKPKFDIKDSTDLTYDEALEKVDATRFSRNIIDAGNGEVTLITSQVRNFLAKYKVEFNEDKVVDDLVVLLDDCKDYTSGKAKLETFEKLEKEYNENQDELEAFFEKINIPIKDDVSEKLDEFANLTAKYSGLVEESERKHNILVQFESENDIKEICEETPENLLDVDDIREEIAETEEELEKENKALTNFRNRLEEQQEERDKLLALSEEIEYDEELLSKYEKDYELMGKTLEYLTKAKNALSLKYTGPTMEGFKKYSSLFEESDSENFRIDTDLNLTKTEEGMQRRIADLSLGLREVTDFCLRLALIDAMYEKEKPFVIMDDPFVNFDERNLKDAIKTLKKISENMQILYFTCHESRTGFEN